MLYHTYHTFTCHKVLLLQKIILLSRNTRTNLFEIKTYDILKDRIIYDNIYL